MAPVNADVAAVETELRSIRLRRNGVALQCALASASSVLLVAASLVIACALRGSSSGFALATTLAGVGAVAGTGYVAWRTWRNWLTLPATARLADTRAALDDRLTTLLAVAPLSPAPALRPLLIEQLVQARPRWGAGALAPRRFSPWLALVPAALAVFVATAFYARPPARATASRPLLRTASVPATAPIDGSDGSTDRALFASPPSGEPAGARGGVKDATRAGGGGAAGPEGASNDITGSAPRAGSEGAAAATGALDRLQQSIRDTFGGSPDSGGRSASGPAPTDHTDRQRADTRRADATSSNRGAPTPLDAAQGAPHEQHAPAAPPAAAGAQEPHGSGRGGAASGASNGLLGGATAPRTDGSDAAPVGIQLRAITGVSPDQAEPQRRPNVPAVAANASRPARPLPDLADEQLADATVRPLAVGPEHEAIIRRIFTRE